MSDGVHSSVNPALLKQVKQPILNKKLQQKDYLKYSAFCQLSNNGDDRSVDDNKSYQT